MRELKISEKEAGQRLDKYLLKYMNEASKTFIFKMLRKKNIKVNGKKAEAITKLVPGDVIQLFLADDTIEKFRKHQKVQVKQIKRTFDIVHEDDQILICNKPMGLLSQGDDSGSVSLVDQVVSYMIDQRSYDPNTDIGFKPGVCNRLDRNTSGIVLVGKTLGATQELNKVIHDRKVDKLYTSIVFGNLKKGGNLKAFLTKDWKTNTVQITKKPVSKESELVETHITPVEQLENATVLSIKLVTGKSHQIRAQLAAIGFPIIGDKKYGGDEKNKELFRETGLRNQLLHAGAIRFHEIEAPLEYLKDREFATEQSAQYNRVYRYLKRNENKYK